MKLWWDDHYYAACFDTIINNNLYDRNSLYIIGSNPKLNFAHFFFIPRTTIEHENTLKFFLSVNSLSYTVRRVLYDYNPITWVHLRVFKGGHYVNLAKKFFFPQIKFKRNISFHYGIWKIIKFDFWGTFSKYRS